MGKGKAAESTPLVGDGPKDMEVRKCTDMICFLIFAVFWIVLVVLWSVVLSIGDVNKVLYGIDYEGNVCGHEGGNISKLPKVWYPRIGADIEEHPDAFVTGAWWDIELYGLCVDECPTFDMQKIEVIPDYGWGTFPGAKAPSWEVYMDTVDVVNRCIPNKQSTDRVVTLCTLPNCTTVGAKCSNLGGTMGVPRGAWEMTSTHPAGECGRAIEFSYGATVMTPGENKYVSTLFESMTRFNDTVDSLQKNWVVLLVCGVVFSIVINFAWLGVFYLFARIAVWASIWLFGLALALSALFSFIKAGLVGLPGGLTNLTSSNPEMAGLAKMGEEALGEVDEDQQGMMMAIGWILSILTVIFAITICCVRKAIDKCVVLVQQASLAIGSTPGLAVLPLATVLLQALVICLSIFVCLVIPTVNIAGTYEQRVSEGHEMENWRMYAMMTYVVVGAVWTYTFLTALTLMTVAACVFYYYFVNKKTVPATAYMEQYDDNQTQYPVITHLGWVLRYHVGTLAFGSLIVTIVIVIQMLTSALFDYLRRNAQDNSFLKMISCCVQCCLECFRRSIEFINSYAYIYCFVQNVGFCEGCMKTFQLMLTYPGQVAINTTVQKVLGTLLCLTTPLACGMIAYAYFDFMAADAASHTGSGAILLPFSVFVIALLMTIAFAGIWQQVVQALTVCVIQDVDSFHGKFLRPSMMAAFDNPVKVEPKKDSTVAP